MLVNCFLENRVRPWQIQAKEHHGAQWEGWKRNHKHEVGKEVGDWDGSQCSTFNSSMVPYYQVYWGTGKSSLECQIKLVYMWSLVSARSDKSSYGTVIKWSRCAFLEKVFFIYWDKEPHFKNSYCGHYSIIEFINIGIFITLFFFVSLYVLDYFSAIYVFIHVWGKDFLCERIISFHGYRYPLVVKQWHKIIWLHTERSVKWKPLKHDVISTFILAYI